MKLKSVFETFWEEYYNQPIHRRRMYFELLTHNQKQELINSLYKDGWIKLFIQNYIDEQIDEINQHYNIDLISMRIQSIKNKKVFLVEKKTWDIIEEKLCVFDKYFSTDSVFGGLLVTPWGKRKQFYRIRYRKQ